MVDYSIGVASTWGDTLDPVARSIVVGQMISSPRLGLETSTQAAVPPLSLFVIKPFRETVVETLSSCCAASQPARQGCFVRGREGTQVTEHWGAATARNGRERAAALIAQVAGATSVTGHGRGREPKNPDRTSSAADWQERSNTVPGRLLSTKSRTTATMHADWGREDARRARNQPQRAPRSAFVRRHQRPLAATRTKLSSVSRRCAERAHATRRKARCRLLLQRSRPPVPRCAGAGPTCNWVFDVAH